MNITYKSHPDKDLQVHTEGVRCKMLKNTLPINQKLANIISIFHDTGKINPNFQKKLFGTADGYSNHSYLSLFFLINYLNKHNRDLYQSVGFLIISNIISHHHGNLQNIKSMLNQEQVDLLRTFVYKNDLDFSTFLGKHFFDIFPIKKMNYDDFKKYTISDMNKMTNSILNVDKWEDSTDILSNYINTIHLFGTLIEADKRDASNNTTYHKDTVYSDFRKSFIDSVSELANKYSNPTNKLNVIRNSLRNDVKYNFNSYYYSFPENETRVFTVSSPTGSGKTFLYNDLAKSILKATNGDYSIIYALPYLSITNQVHDFVLNDLGLDKDHILVATSDKNYNYINDLQEYLETSNSQLISDIIQQDFSVNTYDYPYIITSYVDLFQTLLTNKNATSMKHANLTKRIIIIDEIQTLHPSLYKFFTAYLERFCKLYDCYCIIGTATMPHLSFDHNTDNLEFFGSANNVVSLTNPKFFTEQVFNRYKILPIRSEDTTYGEINFHQLGQHIIKNNENKSKMIVLNTIGDSKLLYNQLLNEYDNVVLLNSQFLRKDKSNKIEFIKKCLDENIEIVVVTTQVIEAGVDLDFEIVYRDACPLPSLIQTAGRCNRNNKHDFGIVYYFMSFTYNDNGNPKYNFAYIYEADLVFTTWRLIQDECFESDLSTIAKNGYFKKENKKYSTGRYTYSVYENEQASTKESNLVDDINMGNFANLGNFHIINNYKDVKLCVLDDYTKVLEKIQLLKAILNEPSKDYSDVKIKKLELDYLFKIIYDNTIEVTEKSDTYDVIEEFDGIKFIGSENYSKKVGLL